VVKRHMDDGGVRIQFSACVPVELSIYTVDLSIRLPVGPASGAALSAMFYLSIHTL
jgi:hypothetical protein